MSKAYIRILFFFLGILPCAAQEGNYPLTHFPVPAELDGFYPHQIIQDRHGMLFMAYNRGVIRFDGEEWQQIHTPSSIFTMVYYAGKIYTGGPFGFGMIERGTESSWVYRPLHTPDSSARITEMAVHKGRLIGLGENAVFSYNLKENSFSKMLPGKGRNLQNILKFRGEVYLTNNFTMPLLVKDDTLAAGGSQGDLLKSFEYIAESPGGGIYLAGSGSTMPELYDGGFSAIPWKETDNEDLQYLRESEIKSAVWVSDTLVALASLKGGVIFIQPFKGKITKIVNGRTGLPDNEVFDIAVDNHEAAWVAHEGGLTRISPNLPYRTFQQFPGLEGNILSVSRHRDNMYVGTTSGLYKLERIEHVRKIPVRGNEVNTEVQSRGFWNKIWPFKKKDSELTTKFIRELQSVDHIFTKVAGPESKVFHLVSYGDKLFASGLDGLFLIEGSRSQRLTTLPVRYFHYSPFRDRLYLSSYDGEVFEMPPVPGASAKSLLNEAGEPIFHMFEDSRGNMFFCGVHTLYRIPRSTNQAVEVLARITNPYYDETFGYARGDSIFFLHKTTGDYTSSIVTMVDDTIIASEERVIQDVIPGANDIIWVKENEWKQLGKKFRKRIPDLAIFRNASYIAEDREKEGLWIITGENNLFFLEDQPSFQWTIPYSAYLYEVYAGGGLMNPENDLIIDQENGTLRMVFSQAEFTGLVDLEYQYFVEGLDAEWSDWSQSHQNVDLSYVPAGKYTLHYRTRNSLGQMETLAPVYFEVLAPYWKRPWFYLMEFAFIGLMLLISVRMKAMGYKYRLMSRLLALLTLIIIIELIQILAESKFETETSPVVDFVIQVIIAITILPVEEILRKYIFKEKHVKVSDLLSIRERRRKKRNLALKSLQETKPVES